ncbi:MAG: MOSC domain-containing protein [Acidimicrobiia bacterium]|nr:MOSC domain-containing protein [Acidimicrobiia bacterium]
MGGTRIGTVSELRRYPVKSMLGEELQRAPVTAKGVVGDRQYALIDDESGKVISVKRPKRWGRMFELTAATTDDVVRVSFPDGTAFAIDDPALAAQLSEFFGRSVSVTDTAPGTGFEEVWAGDLKDDAPPYLGMESEIVDDEQVIDGGAFMVGNGNFFDFGALHLVSTASTKQLANQAPETRFDPRRFRPNIVVDTPDVGFVETEWQGRTLTVGDVPLAVSITVPRCVMTTLPQGDLPGDRDVLRTISRHNKVDILGTGTPYPCVGVYADAVSPGEIAVGDAVTIK